MLQIPETQPKEQPSRLKNIEYLANSSNKNEQISWKINNNLAALIEEYPQSTIIHHYYFNKTKLPGQKSQFSYKDIALNEELLNNSNISFLSGHLHQTCSYKNYLCIGSVRSTSPLEINQEKFLFQYNEQEKTYYATPIRINPYLQYEYREKISQEQIEQTMYQQSTASTQNFL